MNLGETGQHIDHHFFSFESDPSPEIKKNTLLYCQGLGLYFFGLSRGQKWGYGGRKIYFTFRLHKK